MQALAIDPRDTCAMRQMTPEQLMQLGAHHVVYLKARMHKGNLTFILYGAQGNFLWKFDTIEEALEIVGANGLSFATVH
jgi:hypothetical protein